MTQKFESGSHVRLTKDLYPYKAGEVLQYFAPAILSEYSTVIDSCGHQVLITEDAALEQVYVIEVSEIRNMVERRAEINALELNKIVWQDEDGIYINLDEEEIAEWQFTGLSNMTFAECCLAKNIT